VVGGKRRSGRDRATNAIDRGDERADGRIVGGVVAQNLELAGTTGFQALENSRDRSTE
jgi:hypothetical protein